MKAAEEAKVVVANLEAAVKQAQTSEAATADPVAKAQIQAQVSQLQAALQGAKADAANKDAAAKSATTTPATTTGGGGGKTTTSAGGAEDKVKAAEEAKVVVANLEAAVKQAQTSEAATADPVAKAQIQAQVSQLQAALQGAKADAANKDAAAKSATTPAKTTGTEAGKATPAKTTGTEAGKATPAKTTGGPPQQPKKVFNDNNDRKIKFVDRTKVIYRDNDDTNIDKQYIISSNKNTCPTQSETVALNGKINPKGIRILADFDPCRISDGSVTLNMPNTGSIKLALLFIDNVGNNNAGVLVKPLKIQDLSTNQALFSVELDGNMNGINPLSGQSTSISRINGLALYNDGNEPIQFNSGNMTALTATFTK